MTKFGENSLPNPESNHSETKRKREKETAPPRRTLTQTQERVRKFPFFSGRNPVAVVRARGALASRLSPGSASTGSLARDLDSWLDTPRTVGQWRTDQERPLFYVENTQGEQDQAVRSPDGCPVVLSVRRTSERPVLPVRLMLLRRSSAPSRQFDPVRGLEGVSVQRGPHPDDHFLDLDQVDHFSLRHGLRVCPCLGALPSGRTVIRASEPLTIE